MVKCPNCGIEYDDNVVKCSICGYNFKKSPDENIKIQKVRSGENKFNIQAILAGTFVYSGLVLLMTMLIMLLGLYHPLNIKDIGIMFAILVVAYIIPIVTGNILACWIGNSTYRQSMLNGGIIGILPVLALSILGYSSFTLLFLLFIMGSLGGILGRLITVKLIRNPQKKYMEKIRVTMVFLFVITGCVLGTSMAIAGTSNDNMTYDQNGISFSYIGGLVAQDNPENTHLFGTGNNLTVIAALNGVNNTGTQLNSLVISKGPATLPLHDHVNAEKESIQNMNCTVTSETNLTVDGVPATEIDYNSTGNMAGVDTLLIKNNTLYNLNFNYDKNNNFQRYIYYIFTEKSLHIQ